MRVIVCSQAPGEPSFLRVTAEDAAEGFVLAALLRDLHGREVAAQEGSSNAGTEMDLIIPLKNKGA